MKRYVRSFLFALLIGFAAASAPSVQLNGDAPTIQLETAYAGIRMHGSGVGGGGFTPFVSALKIGGGGWNTRCMTGTNGFRRCRTDTYGAFQWDPTAQSWNQLLTQTKMPAAHFGFFPISGTSQVLQLSGGTYSLANSTVGNVFYFMQSNGIYVSTDNGATIVYDNFTSVDTSDPNDNYRQSGPKMAVDPNNPAHVIAGTSQDGIVETMNGTAGNTATWANLPTIPTATADPQGLFPGYTVIFDPSSAHNCRAGAISTCVIYVFAYTTSTGTPNGKVWKSADGGASWTATTGGPTTSGDMAIGQTGGVLWVADQSNGTQNQGGNLWAFNGTSWTQKSGAGAGAWICSGGTSGNDNCHSIAINPANASIMAVSIFTGSINYTANGGTTWAGGSTVLAHTVSSPNVPWMTAGNFKNSTSDIEIGNISYDPSLTDTLIASGGLGAWTTVTTGTTGASTIAYTGIAQGTEQLVAMEGVNPNGTFVVGNQDKASFFLNTPNSYPSDGANTYKDSFALAVTFGIDWSAPDHNFLAQLVTPSALSSGDNSGFSTNGGASWLPYTKTGAFDVSHNGYVVVTGDQITNCSPNSNQPIFPVPGTAGLSTWANGSGTILKLISSGFSAPLFAAITVIDSTHIRLDSTFNCSNFGLTSATQYQLLISTNPTSDLDGGLYITNIANNGSGLIRVTFANGNFSLIPNGQLCISGVGGTIPNINGCWPLVATTQNSADLYGSSFSGSYTVGTGIGVTQIPQGGYVAVASDTNITEWPSNQDHPVCTTDGGQTWTTLTMGSGSTAQPVPARITNAVWSSANNGQVTFTTSVATNMQVGETFNVLGINPTTFNQAPANQNFGYTAIAGTTGTTVVGVGQSNVGNLSASFTGTGSGTNLTTSAVTGTIRIGWTVTGTGVPASTTIVSQTSGTTGGAGVYVTSNATTSAGAALTINPGTYVNNGVLQPNDTGWGFAYYTFRHTGVADRVAANTFYSYNYLRGIYKHVNCAAGTIISAATTAGGAAAAANNLFPSAAAASLLKSVPGTSGEMLFTAGLIFVGPTFFHPQNVPLWHTLDGNTWAAVAGMTEPIKMDCGAVAPTSNHPTCFVLGWFNNIYGLWRTTGTNADWASGSGTGTTLSWTNVATGAVCTSGGGCAPNSNPGYPGATSDTAQAVVANQVTWNSWAMGFGGSGWIYGQQNFLLKRDLDPASNDNTPMWLETAA